MRIEATELDGVFEIGLTPHDDERGFFARLYCPDELSEAGIAFTSTQINLSRNLAAHTLRGMHFQESPFAEAKIVRAVTGAIYDVAVDLRPESPTYRRWIAATLTARDANALFLPEGIAHGFLTLEPQTDVLYQMGRPYTPGHARGFRYDDPSIAIDWPFPPRVVGAADLAWPPLSA